MALTFAKKKPVAQTEDENPLPPKITPKPAAKAAPPAKPVAAKPAAKGGLTFMKKGKDASDALANEEAQAELRKQEQGKLWRFWMPQDEERQVTFLDGDLDEHGMLDIPMFYEHQVKQNGNWTNFVCTSEQEPCPICEKGESKPSLVGVLTVIDHTPHKIKSGQNEGKTIQNSRKLFVAKRNTIKLLTKAAVKRGGLAGCTFDVTRTGEKDPSVGSSFEFVQKFESGDEIAEKYDMKPEDIVPAEYETEIQYRTADELCDLGIGKKHGGPGTEKGLSKKVSDQL